ncbi:D-amino-acid transaminase [Sphingorhabdus sp.]|uniref:D-amino-acid transaminase n=1 Tax=Sphingorhabdus sp. TaxID=1902408 RepID=UPI0032B751A6
MRTVYLNGHYILETDAKVSIFDRGFLFADAVYEVVSVIDGKLIDFEGHVARLHRSMTELRMPQPPAREELLTMCRELAMRNALTEGMIYFEVTRGNPGDRDFLFPSTDLPPTIVGFTQNASLVDRPQAECGVSVVTLPDRRWQMAHVKTTQLLYASLMKAEAKARGADDAWLVRDGFVTEGTSQNAHIVTKEGKLITHPLDSSILHGITQTAVLELARQGVVEVETRSFTVEEAKDAAEAMVTAASAFVLPVTRIDGVQLGDGTCGPITRKLRKTYIEFARNSAI